MLRYLVLMLAALWVVPRLFRLLSSGAARTGRRRDGSRRATPQARPPQDERLKDLTQQDIADAEFEELPPDK